MSIIYCEKHDRKWDSDFLESCPRCEELSPFDEWWESQPPGMKNPASKSACRRGWEAAMRSSEADQRDAARYRWLRDHTNSMSAVPPLTVAKVAGWGLDAWSGDNLDAAIDAAMKSVSDSEEKESK